MQRAAEGAARRTRRNARNRNDLGLLDQFMYDDPLPNLGVGSGEETSVEIHGSGFEDIFEYDDPLLNLGVGSGEDTSGEIHVIKIEKNPIGYEELIAKYAGKPNSPSNLANSNF